MAMITPLIALLTIQGPTTGNWNPKVIDFDREFDRVRFNTYLPSKKLGFQLIKTRLVWVPKTSRYPELPSRQAIRFTLRTPSDETVELIEVPGPTDTCMESLGQVVGDGYLGLAWTGHPPQPRWKSQFNSMPGTCVSVSSNELSMSLERIDEIVRELKRVRRNEQLNRLVWD